MNKQSSSKILMMIIPLTLLLVGVVAWQLLEVRKEQIEVPKEVTPPEYEYIPGQIIVGFKDGVSKEEARALIKYYELWIISEALFFEEQFVSSVRVRVKEDWFNRRGQLAKEIEKEKIVLWARGEHYGIRIQFKENVTRKEMKELINKYEMLSPIDEEDTVDLRVMLIKVPIGEEREWVEVFAKEDIVEYAQVNHILRPL